MRTSALSIFWSFRRGFCATTTLDSPENRFGIRAKLCSHSPIQGIFKSTPSDFEVTELLSNGRLATFTAPQDSFELLQEESPHLTPRAIPTTKDEFVELLAPHDEEADRAVEELWQFIETQRLQEHEVSFAKFDISLPALADKAVQAQFCDYLLSRGLQFGLRQIKAIPDGIRVFVPSVEYVEISRVLTPEAASEVMRLGNSPSFADSPTKLELNATHLRRPRAEEELLAQLVEVRDCLKRWRVLSVGLIDKGRTLLLRYNDQIKPPASELKYLGFVVRKENVEHQSLLAQLARHLSLRPDRKSVV